MYLKSLYLFYYIISKLKKNKRNQKGFKKKNKELEAFNENIFNTDLLIQETLNESEPQHLVVIQEQIRVTETEEDENQFSNQITSNHKLSKEDQYKRQSFTITLVQKDFQDETTKSLIKKIELQQNSSNKNNNYFQLYKQIEDLEILYMDYGNLIENALIQMKNCNMV
ncbi:unnamed protein product [Paramecium sonneborni]|uniref:Uncharacterized protein n=1 Tax=Paramecium sonneborni TaxID=65129 RepID=A0A8S1MPQ8_9CILI|nr:unnamed protein product [Paramecium sonneborni]